MRIMAWAKTDTGRKRDHNEDGYLVDESLGLFAVADGMGGHQGGEHASRLALQVMYQQVAAARADYGCAARAIEAARRAEMISRLEDTTEDLSENLAGSGAEATSRPSVQPVADTQTAPAASVLRAAAREAGFAIFDAALAAPHLRGMGTTLTAMLYVDGRMHVAHAGDSRCYLFRDNTIRQITDDHSWTALQVRAGNMTADEAKTSRFRHVITRSVGFERDVEADTRTVTCAAGDCFVLCSDGLSNYVDNAELEQILATTWFRRAPQQLVDLANQRGGEDNVTVVTVMVANERV